MTQLPKEDLYFLWIKAIIKNTNWKYLLLLADRSHIPWHKPQYRDIPWWRVDRDIGVEDTLRREILEETWLNEIVIWDVLGTFVTTFRVPYDDVDYGLILTIHLAETTSTHIVLSKEHIKHEWCTKDVLVQRLSEKYPEDFLAMI